MNAIAEPLSLSFGKIRFRSKVNGRIFSLVMDDGWYELVQLESNRPYDYVKHVLYVGVDGFQVMNVIWKEVNDVQPT